MTELELERPPQADIDTRAELSVVTGTVVISEQRLARIQAEIAGTTSIAALAGLHDARSLIAEELADAREREQELLKLLAAN